METMDNKGTTDTNINIDNLASDIQSFLNSMQNTFEENKAKDARINMELDEDNKDAKDITLDESDGSVEELDGTTAMSSSIDTSNISEDDSDFEESDLDEMF